MTPGALQGTFKDRAGFFKKDTISGIKTMAYKDLKNFYSVCDIKILDPWQNDNQTRVDGVYDRPTLFTKSTLPKEAGIRAVTLGAALNPLLRF